MKSGNLNFLENSGPLQAYNGTALRPINVLGLFRLNDLHLENKRICSNCTIFTLVLELTGICQCTKSEIFLAYEYFSCGE